ncbi:MAG: M20 family peptidase [Candidatus Methanofastidiosia archaeon]|jgi:carboxypeptidase PM20D1
MLYAIAVVIIGGFILVLVTRAVQFTSKQVTVPPVTDIKIDEKAASRLGKALQFKTISYQDPAKFDKTEFLNLHKFLKDAFPTVHSVLTREVISDYSLLYTWQGTSDSDSPILLMAHMDVVPIEEGTEETWVHPPFSGEIKEGYIWGRGSMDIKCGVIGILEAVEHLLQDNFTPERTIYLAFGHDEEVGGPHGAKSIAATLKKRGINLEYVLDEGGVITQGVIPGVSAPVALVGIAEKGYISLELTVKSEGGHSSMPPKESGIGVLSKAIQKLERNRFPSRIQGVVTNLFEYTGPEMPFTKKLVFANLWLFKGMVKRQLAQAPKTNALIRTTTAPTIVNGGTKENILPKTVKGVVNFRILPGDTIDSVTARVKQVINDPRVDIKSLEQTWNPSPVSDIASDSFYILQKTVRQIFPNVVVAPYLVTGATDSRHYAVLTNNVFKLVPYLVTPEDLKRVHGTNERLSVTDYEKLVKFFVQLIKNCG